MSALPAPSDAKGVAGRLNFERACALTFDPVQQSPSMLREVARSVGFRRVVGLSRLEQIVETLADDDFEVLILDADSQRSDVFDLVRGIRHGRTDINPFVAVVTTVSGIPESQAGQMLGAGMDTVIVKPFSVEDLYTRLATIVRVRKRFVSTPTYIGPDRRDDGRSGGEAIPLMEVPNTLADSVLNRSEDRESQIGQARHAMVVQRVQRMGAEMQRRMEELVEHADPKAGRREAAAALETSLAAVAVSVEYDGNAHLVEMLGAARQAIGELAVNCNEIRAMAVVQTGGQLSRMDPPSSRQ